MGDRDRRDILGKAKAFRASSIQPVAPTKSNNHVALSSDAASRLIDFAKGNVSYIVSESGEINRTIGE